MKPNTSTQARNVCLQMLHLKFAAGYAVVIRILMFQFGAMGIRSEHVGDGIAVHLQRLRILRVTEQDLRSLSELQPFQLDPVGAHLGDIVVRLLREPALGASPENLGKPHSHFRRNPTLPIHQFGQRRARDSQRGSRVLDGQAQWFNALA